jgi:two-component system OmpR family sensor kinase
VSLRTRLTLLQALILVVGLVLLGMLLVGTLERALLSEVDEVVSLRAAAVADEVRATAPGGLENDAPGPQLDPELPEEIAAPGVYVQILSPDGRVLRSSRNLPGGSLPGAESALADTRAGRQRLETVSVAGSERLRLLTVPVERPDRSLTVVRVGQSLHHVDAVLRGLLRVLGGVGAVILLGAIAATWILVGRALSPLERIAATAERIATTGDVNVQVSATQSGEVGRLGRSFNRMVERLRRLIELQRQLLADTSHELRNPLTVIRTDLDLLKESLDQDTRQEVAAEAEEVARRMSRLVDDLLLLARHEATSPAELLSVNLEALAREAVDRFRQLAPEHTIDLETEPVAVRGDPDRLRQLVANLLDNAVRYTPPGGRVGVEVARDGAQACIAVEDTGVGIEPEHLPKIFDRFYRVDPARSRATGGTGLGLAIVKHVAETHGGHVRAESEPGRGTRFTVTLPAERSWSVAEPL